MVDLTLPDRIPTAEEIQAAALTVADEHNLPRELMLTLCLGESGLGLQSFERWHRWTLEAQHAIQNHDRQTLTNILQRCAAAGDQGQGTDDISFGAAHQTWRWSPEYNGQRYDLDSILAFRARYIEDHWHALRIAAKNVGQKWAIYGDVIEACCRYNSPNLPGIQNPNRPNYLRAQAEAQKRLASIPDPIPEVPGMTVYEQYPDPEPAGTFTTTPKGVIFHGSRSGKSGNPLDAEYKATANYEVNNAGGLGWNATVGPGKVAIHLDVRSWGWNARAASDKYIGVEIAQPTINEPLPDSVPVALADYIFDHVWPVWGELDWHFPSHAELEGWGETGQVDGKTDLYSMGDERMNAFRQKVYDRLTARKAEAIPAPEPPAFDRAAVAARLREILAYHDTTAAKLRADLVELIAMTEGVA